jgi:PQQ-dependent dehydrogenase (methanol/ethanol family)
MRGDLRTSIFLALSMLVVAACHKSQLSPAPPKNQPRSVDAARLNDVDGNRADWLTYGRTYGEQRFSPLKTINTGNVQNLNLAWYVDLLPDDRGEVSTPLVVDGVMYFATSWSRVHAVDAATGKVLWHYDPKVPGEWGINACCDVVNRGVAFWGDKVYVATLDGRLVALNAKDGKPLWETIVIDRAERASITGAPRVIKGRVYIGSAGGEFGVRGQLTSVDATTGAILWRFFTVPGDPSTRPENPHLHAALNTWSGQWWTRGGGGAVWDAMSYDPSLGLLYIGTGNGSPWPQSIRSPNGGDNLYVSSILALRAETGELVWFYQTTPADEWGFDAASQLVLTELNVQGKHRSVLMQAAANGFVYVLDRTNGELISATPFVPVNWATRVDLSTKRPVENPDARYSRTRKPFVIHPGPRGAHSWQPMAFDSVNGLLYIPAMLNGAELSVGEPQSPSRYAVNSGTTVNHPDGFATDASRLVAWDPVQKKARWNVNRSSPVASGVLATAGSLVFQGSTEGGLEALAADTGALLWKFDARTSITAAPITYEVNGIQLIAVVAGAGGARLLEGGPVAVRPAHNTPRLLAFSLQGTAQLPVSAAADSVSHAPDSFGTPAQLKTGKALYDRYCARCHGEGAVNAGPLRDLKHSQRLADPRQWQLVVYAGLLTSTGMPGFMAELSPDDVEAVRAHVVQRAHASDPQASLGSPGTSSQE